MSKTFYMRHIGNPESVCSAMIIPEQGTDVPEWVKSCGLTYEESDECRASVSDGCGIISGRIGQDIIAFWGLNQKGNPIVDIIHSGTAKHRQLEICQADGNL